jgi:hypothetical protein
MAKCDTANSVRRELLRSGPTVGGANVKLYVSVSARVPADSLILSGTAAQTTVSPGRVRREGRTGDRAAPRPPHARTRDGRADGSDSSGREETPHRCAPAQASNAAALLPFIQSRMSPSNEAYLRCRDRDKLSRFSGLADLHGQGRVLRRSSLADYWITTWNGSLCPTRVSTRFRMTNASTKCTPRNFSPSHFVLSFFGL